MWRSLVDSFLELLAPLGCAACDRESEGRLFCLGCELSLEYAEEEDASVLFYAGPIREAIQRLKYRGRSDLGPRLSELMAEHALRLGPSVDRGLPITHHIARRAERSSTISTSTPSRQTDRESEH